jgi:hypothetical protein
MRALDRSGSLGPYTERADGRGLREIFDDMVVGPSEPVAPSVQAPRQGRDAGDHDGRVHVGESGSNESKRNALTLKLGNRLAISSAR